MSTSIMVIPEDFRNDQYILKPVMQAMLDALGKPNAKVRVCRTPLLRGVHEALDKDHLVEIFERYAGMVDLFILCVDRDCESTRRAKLDHREEWAREDHNCVLIAENAWQEVEVWVLAGHDLPSEWTWQDIRCECDPKEHYFDPFARQREVLETPANGRKVLAEEAAHRYTRIKQLCPEDVAQLECNVGSWLSEQA